MARSVLFGLVCALSLQAFPFRIDEPQVTLRGESSAVLFLVHNPSASAVAAYFTLQWLDAAGRTAAKLERELSLPPGPSEAAIPFPLPESPTEPIWYRLRYRVRAGGEETGGTLALAACAAHVFELRLSAARDARPGEPFRVRASARHPVLDKPVAGVRVRGTLELDGRTLRAQGLADENGLATLEFAIPGKLSDDEADVEVEGRLGDFHQQAKLEVRFDRGIRIRIDTDKTLYQPGQTLHMRFLCFNSAARAAAGLPLEIRVQDPEGTAAYITRAATNRFGVAAADWRIPENTRLGDYRLRAGLDADELEAESQRTVKISRYELPNFTVTAAPDRNYYLPGQNAAVEIRAAYLFGKPVPRGHVRVVRETRREWNYRLQKWEVEEGDQQEGEADAAGRFVTRLSLAAAHAKLTAEPRDKFEDLTYTAYVRDPASGRTEQRRFDLRVTGEAIHVYVIQRGFDRVYVLTSYADGTPASCRVRVNGGETVTTDRHGLARIRVADGGESVELAAGDGHGATGQEEARLWRPAEGPRLRLQTDKSLYRPGEPVRVEVSAGEPLPSVALYVLRDGRLLDSRWLDLRGGPVVVEIPWREEFVHEITIGAMSGNGPNDMPASRTVLFPANRDLALTVRLGRAEYRPGEEAVAAFEARLPNGAAAESALGVAVVDAAVGERARTDAESGGRLFSDWTWHRGRTDALAGISRRELYNLDCSKPFPADLDLLAEVMLADDPYWPNTDRSVDYRGGLADAFESLLKRQFVAVVRVLNDRWKNEYHHPRDSAALERDLREAGMDFDSLRDPWDGPYRAKFGLEGRHYTIAFVSAGPDKRFGTDDDFEAATVEHPHFQPALDRVERALKALPAFPQSEAAAVRAAGIGAASLRDPWDTPYRPDFRIVRETGVFAFRSAGPDRVFGTSDDFTAGEVSGHYFAETDRKVWEALRAAKSFPRREREWNRLVRAAGLAPLSDPWGRRIHAIFHQRSGETDLRRIYTAAKYGSAPQTRAETVPATETLFTVILRSAGPDGVEGTRDDFDLATFSRTLKVAKAERGRAAVRPAAPSANTGSITGLVVDASGAVIPGATVRAVRTGSKLEYLTKTDASGLYLLDGLLPGLYDVRIAMQGFQVFLVNEVPVNRRKATVVDATLNVGAVTETVTVEAAPAVLETTASAMAGVRSTPRLREYFPETLLWAPSLETGPDGQAQLRFRLADNITTWKLEVIGSTVTGEVGTATAEIRAFQPFFVEHDPPRVLTRGDEIQLPVTIRNYLDRPQNVEVSVRPEAWFELPGGARREARVAGGASVNAVFPMRAIAALVAGRHRVTATSDAAADAIEKPVAVHPDGEEVSEARNALFRETAELELAIPQNAIAGSARAELKIYPNLISHVIDGIEGILQRPYGCAEQTISTTYPNLMFLRFLKRAGREDHSLREKAQRYLEAGLQRLLGYRGEDGGFSYWGRGESDAALTAYALEFLTSAKEFAVVDEAIVEGAREFVQKRQKRVEPRTPYQIAQAALAGERLADLRRLVRREGSLAYWEAEGGTPFHGWGLAGRLETTALALRALAAAGRPEDKELRESALMYLLRNKDRYGVWWSTQATVRVLDAILAASALDVGPGGPVEVLVNGCAAGSVMLPGANEITGPVGLDLSSHVTPGLNRVSLRRARPGAEAHAQLVATYYVPWPKHAPEQAGPLGLRVAFDKTAPARGETVTCRVNVERSRGYGMVLGEIGLPPGADVDRQPLDGAVDRYEILPDRVVVYLWPSAGGNSFSFRFRPRLAMQAKSAASVLYDYYNPEVRTVVAPVSFRVK